MNIQFKLLSINVYDDEHQYVDEKLTYIPENTKKIVEEFLDTNIQNLIKIGNFSMDCDDSYSYGGAGCGDNYRISYMNLDNCKFAITSYYDSSILDIEIEFNKNFNNEIAFIDVINNMKTIQLLWKNKLKDMSIIEVQYKIKKYKEKCIEDDEENDEDDS